MDETIHTFFALDGGRFATFLGLPPDTATTEDLRRIQVDQRDTGVPAPTMNSIVSALRFFFHPHDRPAGPCTQAGPGGASRKLPVVLSQDEVARLLNATTCLKHQAALSVAYGAGLRVAEVPALKVSDIDSERMLLRVERSCEEACRFVEGPPLHRCDGDSGMPAVGHGELSGRDGF